MASLPKPLGPEDDRADCENCANSGRSVRHVRCTASTAAVSSVRRLGLPMVWLDRFSLVACGAASETVCGKLLSRGRVCRVDYRRIPWARLMTSRLSKAMNRKLAGSAQWAGAEARRNFGHRYGNNARSSGRSPAAGAGNALHSVVPKIDLQLCIEDSSCPVRQSSCADGHRWRQSVPMLCACITSATPPAGALVGQSV